MAQPLVVTRGGQATWEEGLLGCPVPHRRVNRHLWWCRLWCPQRPHRHLRVQAEAPVDLAHRQQGEEQGLVLVLAQVVL